MRFESVDYLTGASQSPGYTSLGFYLFSAVIKASAVSFFSLLCGLCFSVRSFLKGGNRADICPSFSPLERRRRPVSDVHHHGGAWPENAGLHQPHSPLFKFSQSQEVILAL